MQSDKNVRLPVTTSISGTLSELQPNSGSPLYSQLAALLKAEILAGIHSVGSMLPTEDQLRARFSVSRYTVREALRLLRKDNLVASRRGAGTMVVPPTLASSDIHHVMSINDLVAFSDSTRFQSETITMVTVDKVISKRTGLPLGEQWVNLTGYRQESSAEAPACRTEYFIHRDYAAVGRFLHRHQGPVFSLIEDLFGQTIDEVQQDISATTLDDALAEYLKSTPGAAALNVRRVYKTPGQKIAQITLNTHPADRYKHSMTLRRVRT